MFKELYSGVFKPYSDILKPYSGVLELDFPKIEFQAFFFFFFFFSFIRHNSIFYESSISLKLDFKVIEYRNRGILPNILKNRSKRLESPTTSYIRRVLEKVPLNQ